MAIATLPTILLTGATGYVGGHLLRRFESSDRRVRCLVRQPERLPRRPETTEVVQGDCLDPTTLDRALDGVHTAYYLVHSMAGRADYAGADRQAAALFGQAAAKAGVQRIVYLGGLSDPGSALSPHLRSRAETGDELRASGVPVVEFRASIILGAGSLSFEMIRALVERLPVMVCPRWVTTKTQPIAIDDVLAYLEGVLARDVVGHEVVEIGGPDVVSYGEMMRTYARIRGLRRWMLQLRLLTPRLSGLWLALVTPTQARVGRALVEGLKNSTVVRAPAAALDFRVDATPFVTALTRAIDAGRDARRYRDCRTIVVDVPPSRAFAPVRRIGGGTGWYFANSLWRLRGALDRLFGGVGMARGRRHPDHCEVGDVIDGWTVVAFEPDRRLRLKADIALPGEGWLEFVVTPLSDGRSRIEQTATYEPRGVLGRAYWYSILPVHALIFGGMLARIGRIAEDGEPAAGHEVFRFQSIMPAAAARVFGWHERPGAILDLLPASRLVRIESQSGGIRDGGTVVIAMGLGPLRVRWVARHDGYVSGEQFCDEQVSGPFKRWRHTHRVEPVGTDQSLLIDRIEYAVKGGALVRWMAGPIVRRALLRAFAARHEVVRRSLLSSRGPGAIRRPADQMVVTTSA